MPTGSKAATYLARSAGSTSLFDNVAHGNCEMDTHIIPVGWAYNTDGQPKSNPSTSSAASGWREHGTENLSGTELSLSGRAGGFALSNSDVSSGFANRAQIFAKFGNGAGWNPQPWRAAFRAVDDAAQSVKRYQRGCRTCRTDCRCSDRSALW